MRETEITNMVQLLDLMLEQQEIRLRLIGERDRLRQRADRASDAAIIAAGESNIAALERQIAERDSEISFVEARRAELGPAATGLAMLVDACRQWAADNRIPLGDGDEQTRVAIPPSSPAAARPFVPAARLEEIRRR